MSGPLCSNPDHQHGRNRAEVLLNVVLSMPEIRHGGYMVYEILGEDDLMLGDRLTSGHSLIEASPHLMVPMFLGATADAMSKFFHGADPGWEGPARPVGLLVKHRAAALKIRRFGPASQGAILALRDLTFRYACTARRGRVSMWHHESRHPAGQCVCGSYLDAIEKIFPTCRDAV